MTCCLAHAVLHSLVVLQCAIESVQKPYISRPVKPYRTVHVCRNESKHMIL